MKHKILTPPCDVKTFRKHYHYEDGNLYDRRDLTKPIGNVKTSAVREYRQAYIPKHVEAEGNGRKYYVHNLIWFYVTGVWPIHDIHHINNDTLDNRFDNLQHLTRAEHAKHTQFARKHGISLTHVAA